MNASHRSTLALRQQFSDFATHHAKYFCGSEVIWIGDESHTAIKNTPYKQASYQLGQETDLVVFDANNALDANALGAICGCIIGGGALILLLPANDTHLKGSRFYKRLLRVLVEHQIPIYSPGSHVSSSLAKTLSFNNLRAINKRAVNKTNTLIATLDQERVINAIKKVVIGHRNRPLVITSNRGRGKSSAIGMAVNELLLERQMKIIICAPAKAMVKPLLECAGKHVGLFYIAIDQLANELPEAGLVVIDEAGAIPVPLLSKLLSHYSRLIFSTTTHGYEGNGRGFAIRFHHQLDLLTPDWQAIQLHEPIRWNSNDPLEALINDLLLLDAEPVEFDQLSGEASDNLIHKVIHPKALLDNEALLRQLFGLLVIAHYQTRPSDLRQILDTPQISIHAIFSEEKLIAAAIVNQEGGLETEVADAIYRGERRPRGHLVPQILLAQMGIQEASTLKTDRIMRIATHPACRRQQLGSRLLSAIASRSQADYLSTSFGLSEALLQFWKYADYSPVYLGLKKEASSGYHSAVFLKALSNDGKELQQVAKKAFTTTLAAQLGDTLKYYDPALAFRLLSSPRQSNTNLCPQQIRDIKRFIRDQCGFESAIAALQHWLPAALMNDKQKIKNNEAKLLIMRVLQHHNWSYCCEKLGITGKQAAQQALQKTVSVLASDLLDSELSKDGLTRR